MESSLAYNLSVMLKMYWVRIFKDHYQNITYLLLLFELCTFINEKCIIVWPALKHCLVATRYYGKSGLTHIAAQLAQEHGFNDIDGKQQRSLSAAI